MCKILSEWSRVCFHRREGRRCDAGRHPLTGMSPTRCTWTLDDYDDDDDDDDDDDNDDDDDDDDYDGDGNDPGVGQRSFGRSKHRQVLGDAGVQ